MIGAMKRASCTSGKRPALMGFLAVFTVGGTASAALPALPGTEPTPPPATNTPAPPSTDSTAKPAKSGDSTDAKKGIVSVQEGGRTLGVGTVLGGDGRILTALSGLRGSELVDVKYADGHVVRARLGHKDAVWDLALLIPMSGRWTDGLTASETDPSSSELKVFLAGGRAAPASGRVKAKVDARAKDGTQLDGALDLELRGSPIVGAPVVDASGGVVGILVRACKPVDGSVCLQSIYAAPVAAIRNFLVRTPLNAVAPSPWLGIVGAPDSVGNTRGVRVMQIAPASPAAKAGLKTNNDQTLAHLIVAVDGNPVDTPEKLADRISKHSVGETVKLLVLESEKFKEVSVVLRAPP
ncbi:S1C family serine protease [Pendulispora brunnea]|uniref:S1C family serine protease n=1 Tax=Pendulispora brunnea TaxID=2905690 RepID=A0ABZ2K4R0_9BACT